MKTKINNSRFLQVLLFVVVIPLAGMTQQVEVKNKSFYIDGQKFFVKGIGYPQGEMPGMVPWARTFDEDLLHFDMKRILSGGFNTIRTWTALTAQELDVIQQYNIKIIMGIWIDPAGNFANQAFVDQAKKYVRDVLSYSKNYNNIIAYLIMNEPSPDIIVREGYDKTVDLWKQLIDIIHAQHPNRPVGISSLADVTFIDQGVFDFSGFNVYNWGITTFMYLNGYRDYIHYLRNLNYKDAPLIVTEYGLSVSPTGPGNWGYGGNSLTEQKEGDLFMYKSLVDGGAAGSCMFNYSDGWFKGGNEFTHDDHPEEWFGLVNYTSLSDKHGELRPVWDAAKIYQSAIITQPRSSEIYPVKVPVEVFPNDTIKRIDVMLDNQLVYQRQPVNGYLLDTLQLGIQETKDALLVFNCFDAENNLVKSEEKSILITTKELVMPSIQISIANPNFWQDGRVDVKYQVTKSPDFKSSSRIDYIFYPNTGPGAGNTYQLTLPANDQFSFTSHHALSSVVDIFTVGAAFDVTYNNFTKRIVNQLTISRINEIVTSVGESVPVTSSLHIYPNPTKDYFKVDFDKTISSPWFNYTIMNNMGTIVKHVEKVGQNQPIDVNDLLPGIYYIHIALIGESVPITRKMIKF